MMRLEQIVANVLIIGGGFGGIWAALRAAELTDKVVLLEKAYVSRSGASTISGGVTTCPLDSDDLSKWVAEFVTRGGYMCDQDWTWQLIEGQRERVKQLSDWGVPISRNERGEIRRFSSRGMIDVRCMQYSPKAAMEELRRQAIARGVRIVDRVCVTDLLTSDGHYPTKGAICGAFGFDTRSGECIAVSAKQTIIATGAMSMKGQHQIDNVVCDGVVMAYRAGARLVDLEFSFGGTFSLLMGKYTLGSYNVAIAHGAQLINAKGERFMAKYDPVRYERSELARVVAAFAKEMIDGRGPVYVDFRNCDDSYWTDLSVVQPSRGPSVLVSGLVPDPKTSPLAIEPTWGLWNGGRSGLMIDLKCRASLPGLMAAGVAAKITATGTHASAGVPTAFAMTSGYCAGEAAAELANDMAEARPPNGLLDMLAERTRAPLHRPVGRVTADRLHDELVLLESSVVETMPLDAAKLARMVARTQEVTAEAGAAGAADVHDLVKLIEARNIAECARLVYQSALDRTESREQFYRADFPETDDDEWFCWHGLTRTEQGPSFDRQPIPFEKFPLQPPAMRPKHLSPIAAIMSGSYDPKHYE
ncbi:MAG TPA: FAD-binding protein [Pseudolabrys sp.]|nr:FAD-binding protein [Pseudolabrys sp.]